MWMVNLQEIRIPESFRLFSTISTSKLDQSLSVEGLCEILDSQIPFHFAKVPAYDFHFSLVRFVCRTIFHAFCFLYWSSWNLVPCMQKIFYVRFTVHNDNFKSSFCIWKFLKIWPYDSYWFCQMDCWGVWFASIQASFPISKLLDGLHILLLHEQYENSLLITLS